MKITVKKERTHGGIECMEANGERERERDRVREKPSKQAARAWRAEEG